VLGHNVTHYLFEFALDKNELGPCLAVSREWIDDTTLEIKLRQKLRILAGTWSVSRSFVLSTALYIFSNGWITRQV
jgi:hypothetical protein